MEKLHPGVVSLIEDSAVLLTFFMNKIILFVCFSLFFFEQLLLHNFSCSVSIFFSINTTCFVLKKVADDFLSGLIDDEESSFEF